MKQFILQLQSLKSSLEFQTSEETRLRDKLQIIVPEILAHRDRNQFPLDSVDSVIGMIQYMI